MNTKKVKSDLIKLWRGCKINHKKISQVDKYVNNIIRGQPQYEKVAGIIGCPWYLVGVIHGLECSFNFKEHLHNGDSLKRRTVHVPRNRPDFGTPPFNWTVSAVDALEIKGWHKIKDWSMEEILYQLERFNGFGYRNHHPKVKSPYLWSYSNNYIRGKYIGDSKWSALTVSKQAGTAVILKRMYERGLIKSGKGKIKYSIIQGKDNFIYFLALDSKNKIAGKELLGNNFEDITKNINIIMEILKSKYEKIESVSKTGLINLDKIKPWRFDLYSPKTKIKEYRRGEKVQLTTNFHLREFECKCGKCHITKIDIDHIKKLQVLRDYFKKPIMVTSGYRCPAHNIAEGGKPGSQHPLGTGSDVKIKDVTPAEVVKKALEMKFKGIGSYKSFTHLDSRSGRVARW